MALDNVEVRVSTMSCRDGNLVCYPSLPTETPVGPGTGEIGCLFVCLFSFF